MHFFRQQPLRTLQRMTPASISRYGSGCICLLIRSIPSMNLHNSSSRPHLVKANHEFIRHYSTKRSPSFSKKLKSSKAFQSDTKSTRVKKSSKTTRTILTTPSRPRTYNEFTFSTRYPRQKKIRIPIKKKSASSSAKKRKQDLHQKPLRTLKTDLRLAGDLHNRKQKKRFDFSDKQLHQRDNSQTAASVKDQAPFDSKFQLESVPQSTTNASSLPSSFAEMGLHQDVVHAIEETFGFSKPTKTQAYWLQSLLVNHRDTRASSKEAVLCAAETGTGKTLAYLAYTMHRLKEQEQVYVSSDRPDSLSKESQSMESLVPPELRLYGLDKLRRLKRPRAVILVPSKELVKQVGGIAKKLSHTCKLRVLCAASEPNSNRKIKDQLKQGPVDLLVCTSGLLLSLMKQDRISLSELKWLVLDEADTLFDTHFSKDMTKLLQLLKLIRETKQSSDENDKASSFQVILSTATVPTSLSEHLSMHFSSASKIITPNIHRTVPTLDQRFYRVHPGITKQNMLLYVLRNAVRETSRIMIFCNQSKTVEDLTAFLRSKRYNVMGLTRAIPSIQQQKNTLISEQQNLHGGTVEEWLREFRERSTHDQDFVYDNTKAADMKANNPLRGVSSTLAPSRLVSRHLTVDTPDFQEDDHAHASDVRILVATDVGSRGLDTLNVGHVILYDFPVSPIDYLHRVGRTARNGTKGTATSIVSRKDIQLASAIERSVRQNRPLSG